MELAPKLRDELCPECAEHYAAVKAYLDGLGIAYVEDPRLVRGLDYYTRTVFEIQAPGLGAQNAIGGGGRYDRLMEMYGGPATPGLGFALGFERTYLTMQAAGPRGARTGRGRGVRRARRRDRGGRGLRRHRAAARGRASRARWTTRAAA